jgi:hypothetical protein
MMNKINQLKATASNNKELNENYKDFKDMDKQDYSYYSRVLGKVFESLTELKEEEAKYYAAQEAKAAAAKAKKADASVVEDAFTALNAARREFRSASAAAIQKYNSTMIAAKQDYVKESDAARNALATAEEAYSKALREFTAKHPEGFHITLKDGDYETTISKNAEKTAEARTDFSDFFTEFLNAFIKE